VTRAVTFEIRAVDRSTNARRATLGLGEAVVETPVFMPVGTQGAIRTMPPLFLGEIGTQILLANTYHLHQRPGEAVVEKMGGLHKFMRVDVPILTDSGGFQVFSLSKKEMTEEGVWFSYELDGKRTFLSPERSMEIQQALGSDIAMAFDECLPADADYERTASSVDLTARWAERSLAAHERPDQSLFGIVQGGMYPDLRLRSVRQIGSLGFDGYAIGGLSVGEGPEQMNAVLAETTPHMPPHLPRYLMGVGRPQDLVDGVALGVDMFDCVIPTRHARGGLLYTTQGRMRVTQGRYRRDGYPPDTSCRCYTCRNFSRAYLHHLFAVGEVLGTTLATVHNLTYFEDLMARVRSSIVDGTFQALRKEVKALYPEKTTAAPRKVIAPLRAPQESGAGGAPGSGARGRRDARDGGAGRAPSQPDAQRGPAVSQGGRGGRGDRARGAQGGGRAPARAGRKGGSSRSGKGGGRRKRSRRGGGTRAGRQR